MGRWIKALTAALGVWLLVASAFAAETSWLDGPPTAWNAAGTAIPKAPAVPLLFGRCPERERAPRGAEEQLVAAAGWKLESYWPTQRGGNVTLVLATAGYDAMCRPMQFNGFAFLGGTFTGTISPQNVDSRADGVLAGTPELSPDGRLEAAFLRYRPSDPLCCASGGTMRVLYRVDGGALVPVQIVSAANPPTQLPRTGDVDFRWLFGTGVVALVAALAGHKMAR